MAMFNQVKKQQLQNNNSNDEIQEIKKQLEELLRQGNIHIQRKHGDNKNNGNR